MSRFIDELKRSHRCGELRGADIGKEVVLFGWVQSRRDHGGLIFIDLRDRDGLTQIVFDPNTAKEVHDLAEAVRGEWVLGVRGTVRTRGEQWSKKENKMVSATNPKLPTGEIEVGEAGTNRYGYPGHLPEFGGLGGFEVNFLPEYKALHDAGYNILAYDIRNHGMSGQGNGGIVGIGLLEYRDVIGSLRYAAGRPDTKDMKKALLSVCLGADSTAVAWSKHPEEFAEIQAMVMLQPVSANYIVDEFVKAVGIDDGYANFDKAVHERTGFHLAEQSPLEHVKAVSVPTLVAQVHHDTMTRPQDVQDIYDAIPVAEKSLHWIEGTTRRFDGYNYFGVHPEVAVEWFDKYVG